MIRDLKPGQMVWEQYDYGRPRRPVLVLRRALCKDFSKWEQRHHRWWRGPTHASYKAKSWWCVLVDGKTELRDGWFFYRRACPRSRRPAG